jgi:hypothetical protein
MAITLNPLATTGTQSVTSFGAFTADVFYQLASMIPELTAVGLTGTADVINPHYSGVYNVEGAAIDAMTLGAPAVGNQNAGGDSGRTIIISSGSAFAHTLTATGLLETGSASVNVATFAAFAGATLQLRAHKGKWNVLSANAVTFS